MPLGRKYAGSVGEKEIGARLRELRQQRELTQAEVAEGLGIDQSLISEYERGIVRLHGALVVRLAQALKTSPDEILAIKEISGNGDGHAIDRRFLRRLQRTDRLTPHQKKILLGTIDKFLRAVS